MLLNQFKGPHINSYKFIDHRSKINIFHVKQINLISLKVEGNQWDYKYINYESSLINFLPPSECNIESNFHSIGSSHMNKIYAFILSKRSKTWQFI
jgi:hypothetical protein